MKIIDSLFLNSQTMSRFPRMGGDIVRHGDGVVHFTGKYVGKDVEKVYGSVGDYLVTYEDGTKSIVDKKTFESLTGVETEKVVQSIPKAKSKEKDFAPINPLEEEKESENAQLSTEPKQPLSSADQSKSGLDTSESPGHPGIIGGEQPGEAPRTNTDKSKSKHADPRAEDSEPGETTNLPNPSYRGHEAGTRSKASDSSTGDKSSSHSGKQGNHHKSK